MPGRPLLITLALLLPTNAIAGEATRKVLIIGIDGCRPDALLKADARNLAGLIREGAFSGKAQTGDMTASGSGWGSMLTGVWRSKHGIRGNDFTSHDLKTYPHFFRRLKDHCPKAVTASVVHWAPINTTIVTAADHVVTRKEDRQVAEEAEKLLRASNADAVFVHFDDVDGAGHKHGFHPNVAPYVKAIETTDGYVGRLLQAVHGRKDYAKEDWLIIVSTDHGGSGKGHGQDIPEHRTIFVIVSGPAAEKRTIEPAPGVVDVAATALAHLGVPIDPRWGVDGRPVGLKNGAKPFPGKVDQWEGFRRHDFHVDGAGVIVVEPTQHLPGRPWAWRGEFFGAFPNADIELVKRGWHLAYISVPNQFGSPKAMAKWEKFYDVLVKEHGLHAKPALIGLSRGALYCMAWAAAHPDKTLAVYLDNGVCDFKSWPGGRLKGLGTGAGSAQEWHNVLKAFGFKDDQEAIAYKANPVDNLAPLAKAKIPLLLVYGDSDRVVPHKENSEVVYDRYKQLGGPVERIVKRGGDHHPHGLTDPRPIVEFFERSWSERR